MRPKWFRMLFFRRILIALMILLQAVFFVYLILSGNHSSKMINSLFQLISLAVALHIVAKPDKNDYKLTWVFLILLFPVFGGLFYIFIKTQYSTRRFNVLYQRAGEKIRPLLELPENRYDYAVSTAPAHRQQIYYLQKFAGFPVYVNTHTEYLTPGKEKFARLVEELKKAQNYIFLEYFIVEEGKMWNTILDILKEKAAGGVEVRFMYDDMGCFFRLPKDYPAVLEKMGIQCAVFNPFVPFLSAVQNNRDHRKIAVIDGKVAFTGGINLADEYINAVARFGHWKDASCMLEGEAAWGFTLIFLQMWSTCRRTQEDFSKYYPWKDIPCTIQSDGLVQPYADSPMDRENVGEHVYLQIINNAKRYLYINTPYLIVDETVASALKLAAKSGVDVRIVTPHIWDKKLVHITTRSYYRDFIQAGIKIYEYTNGFIHSKTFVADDEVATVGTTNLDFRSLYLHFECGVWMYKSHAVKQIKADFLNTLEICQPVSEEECRVGFFQRIFQDILKLFAPLM